MKIKITFEVDTPAEVREILAAVEHATKVPYRQTGFGTKILGDEVSGAVEVDDEDPLLPPTKPRANINPGEPLIGKIGTATTDLILDDLKHGRQPPQPKYTEHLKLLWKRGIICYDGKEYYL